MNSKLREAGDVITRALAAGHAVLLQDTSGSATSFREAGKVAKFILVDYIRDDSSRHELHEGYNVLTPIADLIDAALELEDRTDRNTMVHLVTQMLRDPEGELLMVANFAST